MNLSSRTTAPSTADTIVRKLGRSEALRKQSVPEVVFAYFHNKYGQKNVVNEYVGSLVNTLTMYKATVRQRRYVCVLS